MDKQQKQLAILGVLLLVLVGAIVNSFMPKKKKASPGKATAAAAAALTAAAPVPVAPPKTDANGVKASAEELIEQQKRADKPWAMNPFYHAIDKEVYQGAGLVLKGVSLGDGRRKYATINSDIVTIGDTIYGYRVEEIDKNKVLLKKGAESYYLVFPEQ